MKSSGIYKISFKNGVYYIGQASDFNRRLSTHLRELIRLKHANDRLQKCFNKYKIFCFEIIENCPIELLNERESFYLARNVDNDMCCNICSIGRIQEGVKRSLLTREKISSYQHLIGKVKPVYMLSYSRNILGRFSCIKNAAKDIGSGSKEIASSCRSIGDRTVKGVRFIFAENVDMFINQAKQLVPFNN